MPPQMSAGQAATRLLPVGRGKVVWIEETGQNDETRTAFRLHLADLKEGTSRRLLDSAASWGKDSTFRVEAACLNEEGSAVRVRLRLAGSGYFSEVREVTLDATPQIRLLHNVTVWDSRSADGAVKAAASWATAEEQGPERRYGRLTIANAAYPRGRPSWQVGAGDAIQPWQDRYITSVAVASDGGRIAYINPHGLWLYRPDGESPLRRLELAPGSLLSLEDVVWAPDGAGLYLTVRRGEQALRAIYFPPRGPGIPTCGSARRIRAVPAGWDPHAGGLASCFSHGSRYGLLRSDCVRYTTMWWTCPRRAGRSTSWSRCRQS